ncbi:MAG: multiheme c-type cytochrome [Isosphaerales bacterium]
MARDDAARPDPRPQADPVSTRAARVILALGLAAVVSAALWVAFAAKRSGPAARRSRGVKLLTVDRPFPAGGRFVTDPYVGPQVCSECHPGEAALYSRSGHASTLRPVGRGVVSRLLDGRTIADPESPGILWSYRLRDGQLHLARKERGQVEECILEYAFGSGHHATTFVSVVDPEIPAILEHRLTYYTQDDTFRITPGHKMFPKPPGLTFHGKVLPPDDALRCFHCHSTAISARDDQRIDEETMIPNVSCERCHGPGRAHVAAARRGAPESELSLPFGPDRWSASTLLTMCGACHRHPSQSEPDMIQPDDTHLARFQPVGIMQSRCYVESGGSFSCVTCHDPHARVSADRESYEAVCLSCHTARGPTAAPAGTSAQPAELTRPAGTPCPVSPRKGCVGCHMPRVDAGQNLLFHDHWIRIRRGKG